MSHKEEKFSIDTENLKNETYEAAKQVLELPNNERKFRVKKDIDLLSMAAETERFGSIRLCYYKNIFDCINYNF